MVQGVVCRLDTVLLTFGYLVHCYQQMVSPSDQPGATVIISSLEQRWAKADQDVFIAAVILNPLYRISPFAPLESLINANLLMLLSRLYRRFNSTEPPFDFQNDVYNYINRQGRFVAMDEAIASVRNLATYEVHNLYYILTSFFFLIIISREKNLILSRFYPNLDLTMLQIHHSWTLQSAYSLSQPILHHVRGFSASLAIPKQNSAIGWVLNKSLTLLKLVCIFGMSILPVVWTLESAFGSSTQQIQIHPRLLVCFF